MNIEFVDVIIWTLFVVFIGIVWLWKPKNKKLPSPCNIERRGKCCCNCANHIADHNHPLTTRKSITTQRGWICFVQTELMAFSGWSEHGECEYHQLKEKEIEIHINEEDRIKFDAFLKAIDFKPISPEKILELLKNN